MDANNTDKLPPLRGGGHELDAENAFVPGVDGGVGYYPDADDISIAHLDISKKTRLKLTVAEAFTQGIITTTGTDPRFTVILPVKNPSDKYFVITGVQPTPAHRYLWVFLDIVGYPYPYSPIRLSPKARLHIIVN